MAFTSIGKVQALINQRLAELGLLSGGGGSGDPSNGHLEFGALTGTWDGYYGIQFLTNGEEFNLTGFNAPDDGDGGGAYLNGGWSVAGDGASAGVVGGYGGGGNGGDSFLSGGFGEATAGGDVYLVPGGCASGAPGNVYIYDQGFNPILTFAGSGGSITAAGSTLLNLTTTGALAFGTTGNDPRLAKSATDEISIRDGSGNYGLFAGGGLVFGAGSSGTLAGALNKLRGYDHVGNVTYQVDTLGNHETMAADWKIRWSNSNTSLATNDTAISRSAAGILLVEDGSGNPGSIRNKVSCVTSLATAAAPTLITPGQTNTYFDNDGGTAIHYFTLPTTWVRGLQYHFTCVTSATSVGIRIQCSPNQTIVVGTAVTTTTSGYIEASDRGSNITITGITSGTWYATGSLIGDWSVV